MAPADVFRLCWKQMFYPEQRCSPGLSHLSCFLIRAKELGGQSLFSSQGRGKEESTLMFCKVPFMSKTHPALYSQRGISPEQTRQKHQPSAPSFRLGQCWLRTSQPLKGGAFCTTGVNTASSPTCHFYKPPDLCKTKTKNPQSSSCRQTGQVQPMAEILMPRGSK